MDQEQRKKTKRFLAISFGSHIAFFLFLLLAEFISPSADPNLFQQTVQIDMVALPDQVKTQNPTPLDTRLPVKDLPPPPATEPEESKAEAKPEPSAKDEDRMALLREKEADKRAKDALKKIREQMKKEQAAKAREQRDLVEKRREDLKRFEEAYRSAIRGNETNQGTSSTGAMQATTNAYVGHVAEKLRSNWSLPVWLQSKGLRAVVRIYIDSRGHVARYSFMQASGNDIFDTQVVSAVKESSPFHPPPEEISQKLRNSGLEVLFPL